LQPLAVAAGDRLKYVKLARRRGGRKPERGC
jgi:hypothetical protein